MAVQMTKSQLIEKIAANNELAKKDVKGVLETLATIEVDPGPGTRDRRN
jgi:DNA-binding protein HU-beta